jgi:cyanophycinase
LVIIGGRLEADNDEVFGAMRRLSGGRIAVFPTASGEPEDVGAETVEDFCAHGVDAVLAPLYWSNRTDSAFDPRLVDLVRGCGSVYFTGGDQSKIVSSLLQGAETPVLRQIRELHLDGGLVAGSSAGAAMMSERIICSGTSLEALVDGLTSDLDAPGLTLGEGLGFFPWGMVDQHFLKRGRLGRLLVATHVAGYDLGFGIDENTAMVVQGDTMEVLGENGAVAINLAAATVSDVGRTYSNVSMSYLDHGDRYDLRHNRVIPSSRKRRARATRGAYVTPAPFHRNAFGSYAIYDLMVRLIQGDPSMYRKDRCIAYYPRHETEVLVELERLPRRSRALSAKGHAGTRFSAVNFRLDLQTKRLPRASWWDFQHSTVKRYFDQTAVAPEARLVLLGNTPLGWGSSAIANLLQQMAPPVGVVASASRRPDRVTDEFLAWLQEHGVEAQAIDVTADNIERVGRSRRLLERVASLRTLLFTGGDQRRLVETLMHRGEPTAVFKAIVHAYQRGATLVAVGGAGSALCTNMIAEGSSCDALEHGASSDAGHGGVVIEEGFGLFDYGIADQNLLDRHRLGRLIVACAEQNVRYGFGICEESGLIVGGSTASMHAIGRLGFVVAELDRNTVSQSGGHFEARGVRLSLVQPGEAFDPSQGTVLGTPESESGGELLHAMVADLARECGAALTPIDESSQGADIRLGYAQDTGSTARLDIESRHIREQRNDDRTTDTRPR